MKKSEKLRVKNSNKIHDFSLPVTSMSAREISKVGWTSQYIPLTFFPMGTSVCTRVCTCTTC